MISAMISERAITLEAKIESKINGGNHKGID